MRGKYHSRITRDIVVTITMGALVITDLRAGTPTEREIAPPRSMEIEYKAGKVSVHRTKRERDAYIAAINADHPGAAVAEG
jgi:hypothetical protein